MKLPVALLAPAAAFLYRLWNATLRVTEVNRSAVESYAASGSMIFSFWHDELFAAPPLRKNLRIITVVSRSRDAEFLARTLRSLGVETARGSSSRGGTAALLQTAKYIKENRCHACVTIDGPRGPRHEVKDGVFFLARHAEAPLVPFRVFYKRAKVFASWDKFQLPLPFTRVCLVFGEPYFLSSKDLAPDDLARERMILKDKLEQLEPCWECR